MHASHASALLRKGSINVCVLQVAQCLLQNGAGIILL